MDGRKFIHYFPNLVCGEAVSTFVILNKRFYKKRIKKYYGAKLIFWSFATFLGLTIFWLGAKERFCFSRLFNIHLATRLGYLGSQWRGVSKKTRWLKRNLLKFIYSEKGKKFCEIFTLLLTSTTYDKCKVKILQNFVAFSEYMNFN